MLSDRTNAALDRVNGRMLRSLRIAGQIQRTLWTLQTEQLRQLPMTAQLTERLRQLPLAEQAARQLESLPKPEQIAEQLRQFPLAEQFIARCQSAAAAGSSNDLPMGISPQLLQLLLHMDASPEGLSRFQKLLDMLFSVSYGQSDQTAD